MANMKNILRELYFTASRYFRSIKLRNKYYSKSSKRATNKNKLIICMFDGRCLHGGLADRIKGIVTVYALSKQLGYDFRINFYHPFNISRVYQPNLYNWQITQEEISYNTKDSAVCNLVGISSVFSPKQEERLIIKTLKQNKKQIHIYVNSSLSQRYGDFHTLYHELFKQSDSFELEMTPYLNDLGDSYICVGARFAGSLGGFVDANKELSDSEKFKLINNAINILVKIHNQHPDKKIYLATDSDKFSTIATELDYVSSLKINRSHIDQGGQESFDTLKGSIIDFIIASNASHIIQIQGQGMYIGGFTHTASYLNNAPYELLKF